MNGKLWAVVRREYLERVRTKGFVIGTILGPLLMAAMMVVPSMIARRGGAPLRVAVVDLAGGLQDAVEQELREARFDGRLRFDVRPGPLPGAEPADRAAALKQAVLDASFDGYVELPPNAVAESAASYYGRNVSNRFDLRTLERAVSDVLVARRLVDAGLDPARVRTLTHELELRTVRLSAEGEREDAGSALVFAVILMMILYVSILMWGQQTLTGVLEEKGSRVIEVLAAGVSPIQLLVGKLIGVGAAGLTQFLVWAVSLLVLSLALGGASFGMFSMPEVTPLVLVSFVVFFVLGFTLYAALYAAVGSAVNNVQEAQSLMMPVMMPFIFGMVCFPTVMASPDGALAVALSMLPVVSPLIMFLRIVVQTPPVWQIVWSIALLAAAIACVLWLSARIYRVGILMYGKKPTFAELMRWVGHS